MSKVAIFTNENDRVVLRHFKPHNLSKSRQEEAALIIEREDIPEPDTPDGHKAIMYVKDGKIEYEYEEQPERDDED